MRCFLKFIFRSFCFCAVVAFSALPSARAAFSNYNSVLLGERASGMGGAFTEMTEDPAAAPLYNPATISRMEGTRLSTTASLFNEYDTKYSDSPLTRRKSLGRR